MRSYWNRLGPNPMGWCSYKREGSTKTDTEKHQKTEAEVEVLLSKAQECLELPEAGRGQEGPTLKTSERAWPYQHLGLRPLVSRTVRINFCCLQSPSWWYFVTTALGNWYKYLMVAALLYLFPRFES